ncbi:uncharacterized protein [Miscanthus floridulus]|uniref:uncharacterized protein n=1 Tax=Miscanthus floridulus TaxID=154761 RepID=UPI003457D6AC
MSWRRRTQPSRRRGGLSSFPTNPPRADAARRRCGSPRVHDAPRRRRGPARSDGGARCSPRGSATTRLPSPTDGGGSAPIPPPAAVAPPSSPAAILSSPTTPFLGNDGGPFLRQRRRPLPQTTTAVVASLASAMATSSLFTAAAAVLSTANSGGGGLHTFRGGGNGGHTFNADPGCSVHNFNGGVTSPTSISAPRVHNPGAARYPILDWWRCPPFPSLQRHPGPPGSASLPPHRFLPRQRRPWGLFPSSEQRIYDCNASRATTPRRGRRGPIAAAIDGMG